MTTEDTQGRAPTTRFPRLGVVRALALVLVLLAPMLFVTTAGAGGGAYSLDWSAADPPTYSKVNPAQLACPAPPGGGGRANNPLANAAFGTSVESLAPKDMALGQIVPFEVEIRVSGSTLPENGVIQFSGGFDTLTTSSDNFGYDPAYSVYCAFVDYGDGATVDPLANAKIDSFSSGSSGSEIQGTFQVSGLDNGDRIVVEIWVVLKSTIPPGAGGNVQSRLINARTITGDTISSGNQTVPLLQVKDFFTNDADISVTKSDSPDPVLAGGQLTYTLVVSHVAGDAIANTIVVTDNLDPNTTFVSGTWPGGTCTAASGVVTCNIGALSPGQSTTITITVNVSLTAPTAGTVQTGTCTVGQTGVDLCNRVSVTAINDDPNTANNSDSEPTNVLPLATLRIVKQTVGGNDTFNYTTTGAGLSPFSITTSGGTGQQQFTNLTPGARTVTESGPPAGWLFTSLTCTDPDGGTTVSGQTANIDLDSGETVVCTYTNTNAPPTISVVKTANPTSVAEPGGAVTFSVQVNNTGLVPVTLTSLVDSAYGNLNGKGTCATGGVIPVGGNYACSFTENVSGNAGSSHTNRVTATASGATAEDDATVNITNVNPTVDLTKSVTPSTRPEPGGVFNYTLTIHNTSIEPVTITALTDDNPLPSACTNLIGTTLAANDGQPGGPDEVSCAYSVSHTEVGSYPNTASVKVKDDEDNTASDTDSKTVTVTDVLPTVDLVKDVTPSTRPEPGGVFNYTLTIHNTSIEPVTITALTDDNPLPSACANLIGTTLAANDGQPGGPDGVSCAYSVSHTEVGSYPNTASVTVRDNENNTASDSDSETVTVTDVMPDISVTKTADPTSVPETGGNVTFTFVVTNNSVEAVTISSLSDSMYGTLSGDADCQVGTVLAAGASCTFTLTQWVEGDYPDSHVNVFTARATDNDGNEDTATDDATVDFTNVPPSIEVTKTASPTSVPETGGNVTFTYVVRNTSSEEAVAITSLSDDRFGPLAGDADCQVNIVLAAGASCSFDATFPIPAGDYPGSHVNTFTAKVVDDDQTEATDTDDATVTYTDVLPDISVTKTANPTSVPETGGNVTFTYVVTNNATEAATISSLSDDKFGTLTGDADCHVGTVLAAGASCAFDATFPIPAGNVPGSHVNVFTARATDDDGNDDTATDNATVTYIDVLPTVDLTKSVTPSTRPEPGGVFNFTLTIHNTSPEAVIITALTDSNALSAECLALVGTTLAAGASTSCSYSVTHTDAGSYGNTASVTVQDNEGNSASDSDLETVTVTDVMPAIRVTKTADPTSVPETGANVTFTFLVENIGVEDVTLTTLSDTAFGNLDGQGTCDVPQTILIGGIYSCTVTRFLASDSLTAHTNVVTAAATDNEGNEASDTDDATVAFTDVPPAIRVTKTASPTSVPETGANVTFTFLVENIGVEDVTLTTLSDTAFGNLDGQGTCDVPQTILIGGIYSCTVTRFLASDSLTVHTNVVTATAVDDDNTPASDTDDATVDFTDVLPNISVTKTASPTSVPETGGNVTFTYVVKNDGVESVRIDALSDDRFGTLTGDADCQVGTDLAAGASCTFSITRWVAGDYSGPDHVNVFTARAKDNEGNYDTATDAATVDFTDVRPTISVTKTANPTAVPETGGNVTFTFVVKNDGAETATISSLSDSVYGTLTGDADCQVGTVLAAGASCTFSITRWVEGDYSGSDHVNVFTAKATDNDGTEATATDDATVDFTNVPPSIEVTKTASPTAVPETGGNVTFTFVVKNDGAETATISSLSDSMYGTLAGDADCQVGTVLAAGASCEFSITRWVEGDYSGPDHVNVFTARATDNDGTEATDTDDATVDFTNVPPTIEVTKTASPTAVPETGGNVTFTYVVRNTSSEEAVTISSLSDSVYGTLAGDADCQVGTVLAAGASCSFEIVRLVSGDYSGPDHVNVFTGKAVDNDNTEASDTDDATVDFTDVLPNISVTKTASPTSVPETGGNVTFTYVVKNDGVESVRIDALSDDRFGTLTGDADCHVGTDLAAGASCTFSITRWVAGDYSGPDHVNVFTARAKDNEGNYDTATDAATVDFTDVRPTIDVTKTANPTSVLFLGGSVTYSVAVKNTSAEAVTLSSLVDNKFGNLDKDTALPHTWTTSACDVPQPLAAGATYTCSFTATISGQPGGSHVNTVTGTAYDNENNNVSDTGTATVTFYWRGRTPGYWKNRVSEWPNFSVTGPNGSVVVEPFTLVTDVFTVPASLWTKVQGVSMLDLNGDRSPDTLLVALNYKGGNNVAGAAQILLRAATAALLNEQYFGVAYPAYNNVGALIADVNNALATKDRTVMSNLAAWLDRWNNGVH